MSQTNVWWIRRDVRIHDNEALDSARQHADQLIPLFIIEPNLMDNAAPKRKAFLLQALSDLNRQLKALGSQLVVRQGPALHAFQKITDECEADAIFAHEDFTPFARQRDQAIANVFDLRLFPGVVLRHPKDVLKGDGDPYTVYTPYKNKWHEKPLPTPADCLPAPKTLPPLPVKIESDRLPESEPVPGFMGTAKEAQQRLTEFAKHNIRQYQSLRNRLDLNGTSRLSPYLRFGLISAREAFGNAQIASLQAREDKPRHEIRTWINELVWRDFFTTILYHFPFVVNAPFREDYQHIQWRQSAEDLQAWQQGQTGYPVVDACMRQLSHTGWMHNRGRMIVASFLVKDLLINWQSGEDWFMKNLIDGDPAANNGGWQWSAGTGTDAAPYFRIFNPVIQSHKFDPDGAFIAQWVPELSALPTAYRHEPWKLSKKEAEKYAFKLGTDYPHRIVDHAFARQRTLDAYKTARETTSET